MRQIVNISLPMETVKLIKTEVKNGHYTSVSEFMRHLIRLWREDRTKSDVAQSKKELAGGKGKVLSSLRDLS